MTAGSTRIALSVSLLLCSALVTACSTTAVEPTSTGEGAVVGGLETPPGAWPGTATLYLNGFPACGGALVADQWVITAGHCVNTYYPNGGIDRVVLGRHALSSSEGEERIVDQAFRHEDFSWPTLDHDIGLLHLATPATVPAAKLVTPELAPRIVDGAAVTVVGWGSTSEHSPQSDVMRQATMPILPHAQCAAFPHYAQVSNEVICAGYVTGGYDACQGDSGGPLYMVIDDVPVHVGIVSWGIGCARPERPGVYTRLSSYLGWLWTTSGGAIGAPSAPPK